MSYIVIRSVAALSPLGADAASARLAYGKAQPCMVQRKWDTAEAWVAPLCDQAEILIRQLVQDHPRYAALDRSVLMGMAAAERAFRDSGWDRSVSFLINAASSRGATGIWEKHHTQFLEKGTVPVKTSPVTTLGNLGTNIAHHLELDAAVVEHSITCGSGVQALGNAMAWLRSGMAQRALVVAAEAPLTAFTVAQMHALGIYAQEDDSYPCRPLDTAANLRNTMVLGEAAVAVCLECVPSLSPGDMYLQAWGCGMEKIASLTAIDAGGEGLRQSMQAAIGSAAGYPPVVVAHAPGTIRGDRAERVAVEAVYGGEMPLLVSNKWLAGHSLGASGLTSLQYAMFLLEGDKPVLPAYQRQVAVPPDPLRQVMVNAMGFGGNAYSLVVSRF